MKKLVEKSVEPMLLSISIPTYRRPDFLYKNLHEVMRQASAFNDIGIYVSDDSGSAENQAVVDRLKVEFPDIKLRYEINPANLGIDENIKKCIITPSSDYIWLLGEDDVLVDGALKKVRDVLINYRPPFLFANYIYTDDSHEKVAGHPVFRDWDGLKIVSFSDFAEKHLSCLGFIGGCVIDRKAWSATSYEKFFGSYYSHVGGIVDLAIGQNIAVIGDLLVLNRAESAETFTWSKSTFDVYFSFHDVLKKSRLDELGVAGKVASQNAHKLFAVYSLLWLAAKRADGVYDSAAFRHYYYGSPMGPFKKSLAFLISVVPRAPLILLRRLHLFLRFKRTL